MATGSSLLSYLRSPQVLGYFLESRPPHYALGSVDHVVQLSSSEDATQWSLETPLPLKDFIVSKWKIFLQCKIHMTLQSV